MKELLIAVPTLDMMHFKFVESLTQLSQALHENGVTHDISFEYGTLLYIQRDKLGNRAIENGYKKVLWIDSDMVFKPDVYDILTECDKPVVAGVFRSRHIGNSSCLFSNLQNVTRIDEFPEKPFEIKGCGFGCVLTDTGVLERVKDNYGSLFRPTALYGEDLAFCARCYDLDIEIWADGRAKIGHVMQSILWPDKTTEGF